MTDPFANLTPQELQALRSELDARLSANQPQKFGLTLPNGQRVEGTDEEVQAAVNGYWAEQERLRPAPAATQQAHQEDKPKFDQSQFLQKADKDFDAGMQYYFQTKYGYDPGQLLNLVVGAVNKLVERQGEYDFERFTGSYEGKFAPTEKNRKAIEEIVQQMGWEKSTKSYENAYHLAAGKGLLEAPTPAGQQYFPAPTQQPVRTEQPRNYAPPRIGSGSFDEGSRIPLADEFFSRTLDKSPDQIRGILEELESRFQN